MSLQIPSLDDRTYAELRKELVDRIPLLSDTWTDHNPSDPGITILELLAWLGEMIIYRLDQIPEEVYINLLKLVVDRPEPVTVDLEFSRRASEPLEILPAGIAFPQHLLNRIMYNEERKQLIFEGVMSSADRDELLGLSAEASYTHAVEALFLKTNNPVVIPAGTSVTIRDPGGEIFETMREGQIGTGEDTLLVPARHRAEVTMEALGTSDGKPNQSFALSQKPVLLDADRVASSVYNPNPAVTVGGEPWEYRQDLLEAGPGDRIFTVEWLTYRVHFGDGIHGMIPELGQGVICSRYQIVKGPEVRVLAETLTRLLDPTLAEVVRVINPDDATGGRFRFDLSNAMTEGLKAVRDPERAITGRDFEHMATTVFNQLDTLTAGEVARAHARRLDNVGTIAVIVIPKPQDPSDRTPRPSAELMRKVYRFLDRRRLITTRIQVGEPHYRPVSIQIEVHPRPHVDALALVQTVCTTVNDYFHPLRGGPDGDGWPLGRGVYRSEVFYILESIPHVDFVASITLENRPDEDYVELKPLDLPDVLVGPEDVILR
jgi:hypothetical protein